MMDSSIKNQALPGFFCEFQILVIIFPIEEPVVSASS